MNKKEWYQGIASVLRDKSKEICKDNECTSENHRCESFAYFDFDKSIGAYRIFDICLSDYLTRACDSYISLPFNESVDVLIDALEYNDERQG